MRAEAPADGRSRPPSKSAVGHAGASASTDDRVRPTARVRPTVPVRQSTKSGTYEPSDPYVRKFWVAAIGAGAVAELLRLVRAAGKGEDVRLPRHLPILIKSGLVTIESGALIVGRSIPAVPSELRWRFPPSLAAEHARAIGD